MLPHIDVLRERGVENKPAGSDFDIEDIWVRYKQIVDGTFTFTSLDGDAFGMGSLLPNTYFPGKYSPKFEPWGWGIGRGEVLLLGDKVDRNATISLPFFPPGYLMRMIYWSGQYDVQVHDAYDPYGNHRPLPETNYIIALGDWAYKRCLGINAKVIKMPHPISLKPGQEQYWGEILNENITKLTRHS